MFFPEQRQNIQFDEVVHLAVAGGGFLRVPYLHATSEYGDQWRTPGIQSALVPEIIHVPAAYRRSALSEEDPAFRRVVITAALGDTFSDDRAAQLNQESAGLFFKFHPDAVNNTARAFINDRTVIYGEPAFVLDKAIDSGLDREGINFIQDENMPTGWLVFVNRFWMHQRHVEKRLLLDHQIPLHFDLDFTMQAVTPPEGVQNVEWVVPIWGATGKVRAWDARLGESTWNDVSGAPIKGIGSSSGGSITIGCDCYGYPYMRVVVMETEIPFCPLVIADDSGQFFRRDVFVTDEYPQEAYIPLPNGRLGTPYRVVVGSDITLSPTEGNLPSGVSIHRNIIEGVPTQYGANFYARGKRCDNNREVCFSFAINRWPSELCRLSDSEGVDQNTGEYYALQFMPYGTMLTYGGMAYEFRRHVSIGSPWPQMIEVPYVYGHSSRPGALEAEKNWSA